MNRSHKNTFLLVLLIFISGISYAQGINNFNTEVCQFSTVSYSAASSNGPYIWYVSSADGYIVGGIDNQSSVSVVWTKSSGTGNISLTYNNGNGSANLDVNITGKVAGGVSDPSPVCYNTSTTLTTSVGSIIRWEKSSNGTSGWSTISNTLASYNTGNLTTTTHYRVIYSSGGCSERQTFPREVTVSSALIPGEISGNKSINYNTAGGTMGNSQSGSGGSTYQWQKQELGQTSFSNISGATGATYSPGNVTITTSYQRAYLGSCDTVYSNIQTISVNVIAGFGGNGIFGREAVCQTIDITQPTFYNYAAMSDAGPYIWTISGGYIDGPSNGSGISVVWTNSASGSLNLSYDSGNGSANMNVNITSRVAGSISGTSPLCYNMGTTLTTSVGSIVRWEKSTDGGSNWSTINNATGSHPTGNLTTTTQYKVIYNSGACAERETQVKTVSITPLSNGGTLSTTSPATVCGVHSIPLSVGTDKVGTIIAWQWRYRYVNDTWNNWSSINTSPATDQSFGIDNTSSIQREFEFMVEVQSGSCTPDFSNVVNIKVDAITNGGMLSTTASPTLCDGETVPLTLSNPLGTIEWLVRSRDIDENWPVLWVPFTASTLVDQSYTVSNTSNVERQYEFKVRVRNGICTEEESNVILINVDVLTVPGTLTGGGEAYGVKSGTLSLTGVIGNVVRWEMKEAGGTWDPIDNTATITSLPYMNVTTSTEYRAIVKNGACGEEETNIETVTIYDVPTITITGDTAIPYGGSVTLSTGTGYSSYQWIKNGVDLPLETSIDLVVKIPASYQLRVEAISGGTTYTTGEVIVTDAIANQNKNYVTTIQVYKPGLANQDELYGLDAEDLQVTTAYFDGLGRGTQSVSLGSSPNGKDIVQAMTYDQYGRQTKSYLPYIKGERTGVFIDNVLETPAEQYTGSLHQLFYLATDSRPFSETVYEPSPLNRAEKQFGPGEDWKVSGDEKPISYSYEINTTTDGVKLWTLIGNMPVTTTDYTAGELTKNVTTDEENHQVIEFTDKLGRTILKRVQAPDDGDVNTADWADTYYVYDDFGNLRFVLPPEAINNLHQYNN